MKTLQALLFSLLSVMHALAHADEVLEPKPGFNMIAVERGRYLSAIAGCNDCHTAGYLFAEGQVPVTQWLAGDRFGWSGPWGTTYASNLRLIAAGMEVEQWVAYCRTLRRRPPMPWFNLNHMHTEDLVALYQFLRYLGPAGDMAPAGLPPGVVPEGPYVVFPAPPTPQEAAP